MTEQQKRYLDDKYEDTVRDIPNVTSIYKTMYDIGAKMALMMIKAHPELEGGKDEH